MKRIIACILVLSLLLPSGLLDVVAWASETIAGQSQSETQSAETTAPVTDGETTSIEIVDFADVVVVPETLAAYEETEDADTLLVYLPLSSKTCEIVGYNGKEKVLEIPDTLGGYTVCRIGDYAFYQNEKLTSVTLPDTLEEIGCNAFDRCSSLESIDIPEGVTSLDSYAFASCSDLETATLPSTIENLGYYAFGNCESLTTINYPTALESVGGHIFNNCKDLVSFEVPEGVTDLPANMFEGCNYLEEITLPEGLETIGECAFHSCSSLEVVNIPEGIELIPESCFYNCANLPGIELPSTLETIADNAFDRCSSLKSVVVPENVTTIEEYAFASCTKLEEVTLPDGLEELGHYAFAYSESLASINYPLELETVDGYIFYNCKDLISFEVPEGVTDLPANMFNGCNYLETVTLPEGLETIGENAFHSCTALEVVNLPEGIEQIPECCFYNCTNLPEIDIPDSVETIGSNAFDRCSSLESVVIPENVTALEGYTFASCPSLEKVTLPDGLEKLGYYCFAWCESLSDINYPLELETVESCVFNGCKDLTKFVVPEGVTDLPANMFNGCNALEEVTLPSTLETIGDAAFAYCSALEVVNLPDGIEAIPEDCFHSCIVLPEIEIPDSVETIGSNAFDQCKKLKNIVIPEGVTFIDSYAFSSCIKLESVTLPDSLEKLGYYVFGWCESLETINYPLNLETTDGYTFYGCKELTSIEVPEGVTDIPANMFNGCTALEEVILPSTLETIGENAFFNCSALESVNIPEGVEAIPDSCFTDCTSLTEISLPSTLETIGGSAFQNCSAMKSFVVPDGVTSIDSYAFAGCSKLKEVVLPDSLEKLGYFAFGNCESLETINYPLALETVESQVFSNCKDLISITVPEGVTALPANVFYGSNYLEEVNLPSTLKTIGEYAFSNCSSLESITIPEGVESLPAGCFSSCTSLTEVAIPSTATIIEDYTFNNCSSLESIILPEGVTEIRYAAFNNCSELASLWLPDGLTLIDYYAFSNCSELTEVTIPSSVTEIRYGAFSNIPDLVFRCDLHSYAATYAIDNDISIIAISDDSVTDGYETDTEQSYYQINYDGISASGNLSMVAKYAFKDGSSAKPQYITFNIPASVQLMESTLTLDGVLCTNYEFDDNERILRIPIEEDEGIVRFSLKPRNYDQITTYAKVEFTKGNESRTEVVGTVYTELAILNISAPAQISEETVDISGVTIPKNSVSLYVNDVLVKTVTANKAGDYNANLALEDRSEGKRYVIRAETADSNGNVITAETTVTFKAGTPVLKEFTMEHSGQSFEMSDLQGMKPVVTFVPSHDFRFTVDFDNYESIESVYVVSTRSNVKKYMEAKWDADSGTFIAEGYFDPSNHSYVPGTITIEYVRKGAAISFESGFDFTSDESVNSLPDQWKDAEVNVNTNTDNKTDIVVELDDSASVNVVTETKDIPSGVTENNAVSNGYTAVTDDYGKTVYVRQYERPNGVVMEVLDFAKDQAVDYVVDAFLDAADLGGIGTIMDIYSTYTDNKETEEKYDRMYQDILNNPNLSAADKRYALDQLESARTINATTTVMKYALIAGGVVAGLVCGPAALAGVTVGLALGNLAIDIFRAYTEYRMDSLMYNLMCGFRWAIDPSGYVYDDATQERLSGVTVTAYWIPFDEEDPDFWDNTPSSEEYGEVWDSAEYGQLNPLITDAEGRYAWDVPEGWWRVEYVRDGYESTWSEWLPVPPPQTEVNIGMTAIVCAEHALGEWYETKAPTEEEDGEQRRDCANCSYYETEVLPKLNHEHSYEAVVTAPTCTEGGYTTYTCACGDTYVDDETDATGHSLGDWYVYKLPNENQNGENRRDCAACDYYESEEVANNPFTDVPVGKYYYKSVLWAYYNKITSGLNPTIFGVNSTCTREQVVTFLWCAAGRPEPKTTENPFTDVTAGRYYYKAVLWAVENGITKGSTATTFGVGQGCTRAQVVTFIWSYFGRPEPSTTENSFSDVEARYYYKAVLWAVENGVTSGYTDGTFKPNTTCTREQIVTFLYRALVK